MSHVCKTMEDGWRPCPEILCEGEKLLAETEELKKSLLKRNQMLIDKNRDLKSALKAFGDHKPDCPAYDGMGSCSCGWDRIMREFVS